MSKSNENGWRSEARQPFEERKKRLEGLRPGDHVRIDGQTLVFGRVDNPYFPHHIFVKTLEGRPVVIRFIDIESGVVDWPLVPSSEEVGFRFENQSWREMYDLVASCETDAARQEIGREIFKVICRGKESAAIVLQDIILHIVRRIASDPSLDLQEIDAAAARGDEGIFAAEQSVELIGKQFERVRSFVDTIRKLGNKPTSMIDAGCYV